MRTSPIVFTQNHASRERRQIRTTREGGQAIVEFVLAMFIALALIGVLAAGFRAPIKKLWVYWVNDVRSACPTSAGCQPPDPAISP